MLKYLRSYITKRKNSQPVEGGVNRVQAKNVYFLTNNGRVAKGHVGERTYLDGENNKIDDRAAYNRVIASEHPGLVPPFTLGNDQYVLFASAGSLDEFPLTVAQAKIGFLQIINTLNHMHTTLNVVHFDVKDRNIVLLDNGTMALIDFDGVRKMTGLSFDNAMTVTYLNVPPEILENAPQGEKLKGCDIWALGMTMFRTLARLLFDEMTDKLYSKNGIIKIESMEEFKNLFSGYLNQVSDPKLRQVLQQLLSFDADERIANFSNIGKLPFFKGLKAESAYDYTLVEVKKPPNELSRLKDYVRTQQKLIEKLKKLPQNRRTKQIDYQLSVLRHYRNKAMIVLAKNDVHRIAGGSIDSVFIPSLIEWQSMLKNSDRGWRIWQKSHSNITQAVKKYHDAAVGDKDKELNNLSQLLAGENMKDPAIVKLRERVDKMKAWNELARNLSQDVLLKQLAEKWPDTIGKKLTEFNVAKDIDKKFNAYLALKAVVEGKSDPKDIKAKVHVLNLLSDPIFKIKKMRDIPTAAEWQKMSSGHSIGLFQRSRSTLTKKLGTLIESFHSSNSDEEKIAIAIKIIRSANLYLDVHANNSAISEVVANLLQRALYYFDAQLQLHPEIQARDMDKFARRLHIL